jgi:hypothetical protein
VYLDGDVPGNFGGEEVDALGEQNVASEGVVGQEVLKRGGLACVERWVPGLVLGDSDVDQSFLQHCLQVSADAEEIFDPQLVERLDAFLLRCLYDNRKTSVVCKEPELQVVRRAIQLALCIYALLGIGTVDEEIEVEENAPLVELS